MIKILFVGNYLSTLTGTLSVSQTIGSNLNRDKFDVNFCSDKKNVFLRFIDIFFQCLIKKYDKIHIDTYSGKAFNIAKIATLVAKFRGKEIIVTLHGGNIPTFYDRHKKKVRNVINRANLITTPSNYIKHHLMNEKFKIKYVPNPINHENFSYERNSIKKYSLLWVRAFHEIYRPELAIHAFAKVVQEFPKSKLTMVGPDKGNQRQIEQQIDILNLNKSIKLEGPVENKKLAEYYHSHHVYLNTTSLESFGVSVLEAAACGIPIVSSNVGEIPFIWCHGEDVLLNDLDPNAFAENILKIMNSDVFAQKISLNANKKSKQFDINEIIKIWEKIFIQNNKKIS